MKNEHKNLFVICENCSHPLILSLALEISLLPKTHAIYCRHCQYENTDLEELKEYSKRTRNYANN